MEQAGSLLINVINSDELHGLNVERVLVAAYFFLPVAALQLSRARVNRLAVRRTSLLTLYMKALILLYVYG